MWRARKERRSTHTTIPNLDFSYLKEKRKKWSRIPPLSLCCNISLHPALTHVVLLLSCIVFVLSSTRVDLASLFTFFLPVSFNCVFCPQPTHTFRHKELVSLSPSVNLPLVVHSSSPTFCVVESHLLHSSHHLLDTPQILTHYFITSSCSWISPHLFLSVVRSYLIRLGPSGRQIDYCLGHHDRDSPFKARLLIVKKERKVPHLKFPKDFLLTFSPYQSVCESENQKKR